MGAIKIGKIANFFRANKNKNRLKTRRRLDDKNCQKSQYFSLVDKIVLNVQNNYGFTAFFVSLLTFLSDVG